MTMRAAAAMLLALLVPGAGHLYLGRRARGLAFCVIVVVLFVAGMALDGGIYTLETSRGALLRMLATAGSMGSGLLYILARAGGSADGNLLSLTFEYGRMFTLSAGLMNLLLVLDCHDLALEKKP
jgi:hypothetical protein